MTVESQRHTLDELFALAQARIRRLSPVEASAAGEQGAALLIDIRSDVDRKRDGVVPGSLHIPRTVLEWRLDPDSPVRNPHVGGLEEQLVVFCDHGYASVFAAASLVDLGFTRAADVVGGFAAWRDAGLPTAPARFKRRSPGQLAGMQPPVQ